MRRARRRSSPAAAARASAGRRRRGRWRRAPSRRGLGRLPHDRQPEARAGAPTGGGRAVEAVEHARQILARRSRDRGRAPPRARRARAPRSGRPASTAGSICTALSSRFAIARSRRAGAARTRQGSASSMKRHRGRVQPRALERPGDGEVEAHVLHLDLARPRSWTGRPDRRRARSARAAAPARRP